jgi:hypothetical protein
MRVLGCQTLMRNESEQWEPFWGTIDRSCGYIPKDLSKSIHAGTRKMVNYA